MYQHTSTHSGLSRRSTMSCNYGAARANIVSSSHGVHRFCFFFRWSCMHPCSEFEEFFVNRTYAGILFTRNARFVVEIQFERPKTDRQEVLLADEKWLRVRDARSTRPLNEQKQWWAPVRKTIYYCCFRGEVTTACFKPIRPKPESVLSTPASVHRFCVLC